MDVSNVPRRPPPPPPINSSTSNTPLSLSHRRGLGIGLGSHSDDDDEAEGIPLHRGSGGGGDHYIDSPPGVIGGSSLQSPPSFAEALRGSSPTALYWEGTGQQPIPQEDSDYDSRDSPPLYSSGSEAPPVAGLGERLGAFVGYRDHVEPSPPAASNGGSDSVVGVVDERDRNRIIHQQTDHQTPPPPFPEEDEEEEEEEEEDMPRQPPLIIVTGATTGLGLAFFTHFAARAKSSADVPYDVIGIDKTPWRVPGTGFRWQTPVGRSGLFTQLDLSSARPGRLASWAQTYLYSQPVRSKGRRGREAKVRYPRPVRLVLHCAASSARGLVESVAPEEGQGQGQASSPSKKKKKNTKRNKKGAEPVKVGGEDEDEDEEEDQDSFEVMDAETMRRTFDANVVATLQLVQMVTPHLQLEASARDEDLGVLVDATTTTITGAASSSSSLIGVEDNNNNNDNDGVTSKAAGDPDPTTTSTIYQTNNLGWLEALKKQGSRASLQLNPPPPTSTTTTTTTTKKPPQQEKALPPLPSAPRDGIPAPRVVLASSRAGSLAANTTQGGRYAFRASQAALHAVARSLSVDVPEVCFACVDPGELREGSSEEEDNTTTTTTDGTTRTKAKAKGVPPMTAAAKRLSVGPALLRFEGREGGEEQGEDDNKKKEEEEEEKKKRMKKMKKDLMKKDMITCEESMKTLLPMLDKLGAGKLRTGCFVDRFGEPIPW